MQISTILNNLRGIEQMGWRCKNDISESRRKASRHRSISTRFSSYADAPANPEMKQIDLLVAKEFKDRADMDERFVAAGLQRLEGISDLKQHWLSLLERFEGLNVDNPY